MTTSRAPRRVRPQGDYFHPQVPPDAVYVGRHGPCLKRSPFHNPYPVREHGLAMSRDRFRRWVATQPELVDRARVELAGRDLCCWCRLDTPWCHAEDWLKIANSASNRDNLLPAVQQTDGTLLQPDGPEPSDLRSEVRWGSDSRATRGRSR